MPIKLNDGQCVWTGDGCTGNVTTSRKINVRIKEMQGRLERAHMCSTYRSYDMCCFVLFRRFGCVVPCPLYGLRLTIYELRRMRLIWSFQTRAWNTTQPNWVSKCYFIIITCWLVLGRQTTPRHLVCRVGILDLIVINWPPNHQFQKYTVGYYTAAFQVAVFISIRIIDKLALSIKSFNSDWCNYV